MSLQSPMIKAPTAMDSSAGAPQTPPSDWFGTGQEVRKAGFDTQY
jgi:hypothetical protein